MDRAHTHRYACEELRPCLVEQAVVKDEGRAANGSLIPFEEYKAEGIKEL